MEVRYLHLVEPSITLFTRIQWPFYKNHILQAHFVEASGGELQWISWISIPITSLNNDSHSTPMCYREYFKQPVDYRSWVCQLNARKPSASSYHWCAILIAHQIVMAKHGGSCVHFSGISTCGRTSRETVSHPQCPPLPTLCKISLPIYVIVTNKLLQPLATTWYDSLVLSFSLLKI